MPKKFYLTTTLPYVNAEPHIGFALEIVTADVICRAHRLNGEDVVFNTGTDEHGQKIYQNALESGKTPQEYCDEYAASFAELKSLLNLSYTNFIRTTDPAHMQAAQTFWLRCWDNSDIYKKLYSIQYCVGCELEKQASELIDGRCPLHPNRELETREEENYFFRFSKYQDDLLTLYRKTPEFVRPEGKLSEIVAFVQGGLQDFSISRLKLKMPWGVPVPNDPDHVMYVWFDALVNYISTLGWPENEENFTRFWPGTQIAGKDNLRQQAAMWQAMLLSAGLPNSKQILINGFISVGGQKMSKSLGNVIAPTELVKQFGTDATRYLLMQLGPIGYDMDVTKEKFAITYVADLANGFGNLTSRIAKLWSTSEFDQTESATIVKHAQSNSPDYFYTGHIKEGIEQWKQKITILDGYLSETRPWLLAPSERQATLKIALTQLIELTLSIQPVLPESSSVVLEHFANNALVPLSPLFPRIA